MNFRCERKSNSELIPITERLMALDDFRLPKEAPRKEW
jgi:hypothetical protein